MRLTLYAVSGFTTQSCDDSSSYIRQLEGMLNDAFTMYDLENGHAEEHLVVLTLHSIKVLEGICIRVNEIKRLQGLTLDIILLTNVHVTIRIEL